MKVTYDRSVDAAYIYFAGSIPAGGVKNIYACDPQEVGGHIALDFDAKGHIVGVEVLEASKHLPEELLKAAEGTDA